MFSNERKEKISKAVNKLFAKTMRNPNWWKAFESCYYNRMMTNGFVPGTLENEVFSEGGCTVSEQSYTFKFN